MNLLEKIPTTTCDCRGVENVTHIRIDKDEVIFERLCSECLSVHNDYITHEEFSELMKKIHNPF